jgi:hypothetical protein
MRLILIATAAIALGACQKAEAPPTEEAAPTAAAAPTSQVQPGTFEATMKDGSKETTVIAEDGTYVDKDASGKVLRTGKWAITDGKTCFDPDGDEAAMCFTDSAVGPDGTFTSTPDKGDPVMVKKIS